MRLLFYTATITLLLAGGVFAYFAVQTPQIDTSTKVVIGIEPYPSAVAEAKTREIIEQQARLPEEAQTAPDIEVDRLPQEDPSDDLLTGSDDTQSEIAASNDDDLLESDIAATDEDDRLQQEASEPVATQEQAFAQPAAPVAEPKPAPKAFALPGASISGLEPEFEDEDPFAGFPSQTAAESFPEDKKAAPPEEEVQSAPTQETGVAANEPTLTVTESEPLTETEPASVEVVAEPALPEVNEEAATPQPIEQDVVALDSAEVDRLPVEDEPPAAEIISEPIVNDAQAPDVQPEAVPPVAETPQENAATDVSENPEELRATFNAFVASLKEKEREQELALVTPPPLPLKRPENIPAAVRTASLNSGAASAPRVAILLRGLGRNDKNSEFAVTSLPPAISLGFAPYVGSAQVWAQQARERGHEVIIQLPFEPADYPKTDPGPDTILTTSSSAVNSSRIQNVLERFDGYNGVTSYYGGKLLQSPDALRPVLEDIKSRGLIYISEPDASQALVRKLAAELGVIYGGADIVVDNFQTTEVIQQNLDALVELARKNGSAIGLAYASRNSIEQLRIWSETVASKGVTLVPVGVVAQTPGAS